MGMSPYMKNLREHLGTQLVMCPSVAALVRNEVGQILFMVRSDNGLWDLPAGAIDPGETPMQAIVREVREETGLIVEPTSVAGVFGGSAFRLRYDNGDVVEYTVIVFECRVIGGELAGLDGEAAELHFIDPSNRPPLPADFPDELFAAPGNRSTLFA
ncbi:MAG TPA: NUDIX domain-containing protein [Polyangiaceae bacterium]|nr:NUDIX domain-containing protein [Polyangiaceae bacterium]